MPARRAIAGVEAPWKPCSANSAMAASSTSSRRVAAAPRERGRLRAGPVDVEHLLAEAVAPAHRRLEPHELRAADVAVERVGPLPVTDGDDDVIEANAGHACNGDRVVAARACALVLVAVAVASCGGSHPRASPPPGAGAGAGARVVAERRVAPRIIDLTVRSPALGTTAKVRLLTPDGWAARARGRRWPVLYLLHGCCDTYDSWTRSTDVEDLPALRRVLVVMPAGGEVGFYSDWRDGPAWETFHLGELRAILERRYGAGTPRAIAGLSMGGLGAMDYAARHPGMFAAAASYSGALHPLMDPRFWLGLFAAYTSDAVWGDPQRHRDRWA